MQDASLVWGQDLAPGNIGDLLLASATELGQQRILRRLLTNPGDYVWQPSYGAGLARFVGAPTDVASIRAVIRSQIFMETSVARLPEPVIDVQSAPDGSLYVQLRYVDAAAGSTQTLSFSVGH